MSEKNSEKKNVRKAHISEERMKRFTWEAGDLKFFNSKEEFEEEMKKEGRKVTWY